MKKIFLILGIIIIVMILLVFAFIRLDKITSIQAAKCERDSDCELYSRFCFQPCQDTTAYNNKYLNRLKFLDTIKCKGKNYGMALCEFWPVKNEAYCNENKRCDVRPSCNKSCMAISFKIFQRNMTEQIYNNLTNIEIRYMHQIEPKLKDCLCEWNDYKYIYELR